MCSDNARLRKVRQGAFKKKEENLMSLSLAFWVIAIVAIVFGAWGYTNPQASRWAPWPVFILVLILGFAEFGFRLTR